MKNINKEEYQTARVEGFIPAEWEFEDYLLAEIKRMKSLLYHISDLFESGLCYSEEWWATDDCDEQEKLPLGGLKIADSGVHDWVNVHFCSKKVRELRRLLP